jgi:hypothetical protein
MKEWIITDKRQTDKLLAILQGIRRETMRPWLVMEVNKAIDIITGVDKCDIEEEAS